MVHPLQLLLKHCGSWSDKFEFSYVHWMWCVVLGLGHSRARSGPELFLKDAINWYTSFKLICQVIEPTDQRFNIKEGKVTIWVWELLPLTRDKNHYCDTEHINTLHIWHCILLFVAHISLLYIRKHSWLVFRMSGNNNIQQVCLMFAEGKETNRKQN